MTTNTAWCKNELATNPEAGDMIQGAGGFRKFRWVDARRRKGRRGSLPIIYYYFLRDQQIWLMTVYDKNEAADVDCEAEEDPEGDDRKRAFGRAPERLQVMILPAGSRCCTIHGITTAA